jgi:hypothetical protein
MIQKCQTYRRSWLAIGNADGPSDVLIGKSFEFWLPSHMLPHEPPRGTKICLKFKHLHQVVREIPAKTHGTTHLMSTNIIQIVKTEEVRVRF